MFWLALLYLAILATLIIVFVDVPRLSPLADVWDVEEAGGAPGESALAWEICSGQTRWNLERVAGHTGRCALDSRGAALADISRWSSRFSSFCATARDLFGPSVTADCSSASFLRCGSAPARDRGEAIWLPFLGWQDVRHELRYRLERHSAYR